MTPADYWLADGETLSAAASRAWAYPARCLPVVPRRSRSLSATRSRHRPDPRQVAAHPAARTRLRTRPAHPRRPHHRRAADDATEYPVSHLWQDIPVHLLGWNINLDARNPGVAGAARAPQSMVQELLNRDDRAPVGDAVQRPGAAACCAIRPTSSVRRTWSSTWRQCSTGRFSPTSSAVHPRPRLPPGTPPRRRRNRRRGGGPVDRTSGAATPSPPALAR